MQSTAASIWLKPLADENTKQLQVKIGCSERQGVMSSEQSTAEQDRESESWKSITK